MNGIQNHKQDSLIRFSYENGIIEIYFDNEYNCEKYRIDFNLYKEFIECENPSKFIDERFKIRL